MRSYGIFTKNLDLWDRQGDINWLQTHVTPLQGPKRTLNICFVNLCDFGTHMAASFVNPTAWRGGYDQYSWTDASTLQLEVQSFEPSLKSLGFGDMHSPDVHPTPSEDTSICQTGPPHCYAITAESLPSLNKLESWVLETTQHWRRPIFASGVHGTFFALALRYTQCKQELPLVSCNTELKSFLADSFLSSN